MRSPYSRVRQGEPQQENDEERTVIEREYAQDPPNIEISKIAGRRFRIEKDSGDEEAREREKHVYTAPSEPEESQDRAREPKNAQADAKMIDDDQQDRDASNTVQGRNMQARIGLVFRLTLPCHDRHRTPRRIVCPRWATTASFLTTEPTEFRVTEFRFDQHDMKMCSASAAMDIMAPACWGAPTRPPLIG